MTTQTNTITPPELVKFFTDIQDAINRHQDLPTMVNGLFHFYIKPSFHYCVDLKNIPGGVLNEAPTKGKSADCTIEYSTVNDFIAINAGKMDLKRALIMRRLKISGNLNALKRMHESIDTVKKRDAAAEAKRMAGEEEQRNALRTPAYATAEKIALNNNAKDDDDTHSTMTRSSIKSPLKSFSRAITGQFFSSPKGSTHWTPDNSVVACRRCSLPFNLTRRRHHCRACGRIFCHACSSNNVGDRRFCDFCIERVYGTPPADGQAISDPDLFLPSTNENTKDISTTTTIHTHHPPTTLTLTENISNHGPSTNTSTTISPSSNSAWSAGVSTTNSSALINTSERAEEQHPTTDTSLQTDTNNEILLHRIQELEEALAALRATVDESQLAPAERNAPTLSALFSRSELLAVFWLPLLLFFTLLEDWILIGTILVYGLSVFWRGAFIWGSLYILSACVFGFLMTSNVPSIVLLRRRMRVYGVSIVIACDYRLTKLAILAAGYIQENPAVDATWKAAHTRNAARALRVIRDLRGMWVKVGQYLSSRPDIMPVEYVKVLSALQDAMPARPLKEVEKAIEEALGKPISSIFSSIDERALAAASVGQVHRATLLDGTTVAVKVQHRGMDVVIAQDLANLNILLSWLAMVDIGFDVRGVMREWLKEVVSELDFTLEARNMTEVRANIACTGIAATVPRVIPGLVTRGVLVMRFVEGFKVNDCNRLIKMGIDRNLLVARICRAYARQIYVDGLFNSDPHPGNFFVARLSGLIHGDKGDKAENDRLQRGFMARKQRLLKNSTQDTDTIENILDDDWIPVLIDFGLCKRLPTPLRLAFGKLVLAAEEVDFASMMEAMDDMGMTFSRESAVEDLENLQHMFRSATPASEARAANEERERIKKEKEEKRAAAAAAASPNGKVEARRVTAWPSDLMFFLRASELLQGLCSSLETRHPFMQTMACAARQAAIARYPQKMRLPRGQSVLPLCATEIAYANTNFSTDTFRTASSIQSVTETLLSRMHAATIMRVPSPFPSGASRLETRLHARIVALFATGAVDGLQVVVTKSTTTTHIPKIMANICAGQLGPVDKRIVTPATLFPCFAASRLGVAATAAVASKLAVGSTATIPDPDTQKVVDLWSAWAGHGKSGCSVGELLRGRSGVEGALPTTVTTTGFTREKWAQGIAAVAQATPLMLPSMAIDVHGKVNNERKDSSSTEMETDAVVTNSNTSTTSTASVIPAFSTLPSRLSHLFFPLSGRPDVGPNSLIERSAHLWFGWGWAVGEMIAGMMRKVIEKTKETSPTTTTIDGSTSLTLTMRDHVEPIIGLSGGHAVFGVLPVQPLPTSLPSPSTTLSTSKKSNNDDEEITLLGGVNTDVGPVAQEILSRMATTSISIAGEADTLLNGTPEEIIAAEVAAKDAAALTAAMDDETALALEAAADDEYDHLSVTNDTNKNNGTEDTNVITVGTALAAVGLAEAMNADGKGGLADISTLTANGREHLLDPRFANTFRFRSSLIPSMGLYASAIGLTHLIDYLARIHGEALENHMKDENTWITQKKSRSSTSKVAFTTIQPNATSIKNNELIDIRALWNAHCTGLRLVGFKQDDGSILYSGFGVSALGGTFAIHDVPTGFSISITVNRLAGDSSASRILLRLICEELGLGIPIE